MSRHQKGKTNLGFTEARGVSGSGIGWAICKSATRSRQITMPAPHHSVFYRPDALPAGHLHHLFLADNIKTTYYQTTLNITLQQTCISDSFICSASSGCTKLEYSSLSSMPSALVSASFQRRSSCAISCASSSSSSSSSVHAHTHCYKPVTAKGKGSLHSTAKHRVLEQIPVLGSQPAGDVSYKPGSRLPLLSARPAVIPATLKRAVTNFAAW